MRKTISILSVLLALTAVVSFAGCAARISATGDQFRTATEAKGYTITDIMAADEEANSSSASSSDSSAASSESASSSNQEYTDFLVATKEEEEIELDLVNYTSESTAKMAFSNIKNNIDKSAKVSVNEVTSDAYCRYTIVNGEYYYALARVNKSVLFATGPASAKDEIDSIFSELKY